MNWIWQASTDDSISCLKRRRHTPLSHMLYIKAKRLVRWRDKSAAVRGTCGPLSASSHDLPLLVMCHHHHANGRTTYQVKLILIIVIIHTLLSRHKVVTSEAVQKWFFTPKSRWNSDQLPSSFMIPPAVTSIFDLLTPKSYQQVYEPKYTCDQNLVKFPSLVFEIWYSQRFRNTQVHSWTDRPENSCRPRAPKVFGGGGQKMWMKRTMSKCAFSKCTYQ